MKNKIVLAISFLFLAITAYAGNGIVKGKISSKGEPVVGCFVQLKGINNNGAVSDAHGNYIIKNIAEGEYALNISCLGFHSSELKIKVEAGKTITKDVALEEDLLNLEEVVVSGTRNKIAVYKAPVIVSRISPKLFETTQSLSLSEGLAFSPGLRVETNCQNCGFNSLRMNGLDGPYSQILINSRPIYSALIGVYGLDMIPANMIDRVEVVKGGGSAMYGGNAIAGTVNVITKDPIRDSFEIGINQAFTDIKRSDRTVSVNGSIVSDDLNQGISIYGMNRNRLPWDANDDGYSELTKLQNTTVGLDAFWNTSEKSKLKVNMYSMNEFRRGGSDSPYSDFDYAEWNKGIRRWNLPNDFSLEPHETGVTEQLDHKILGGGVSFERYSSDYKHKISIYSSLQQTKRKSYYGAGGQQIYSQDDLNAMDDETREAYFTALHSYGKSKDMSASSGLQYSYDINEIFTLSAGAEYKHNKVLDKIGVGRTIDQTVNTLGSYAQLEIKPVKALTLLVGGRFDRSSIEGEYTFGEADVNKLDKILNIFSARFSAMYDVNKEIKLRASYAQGYRGPQAFDDDLHIAAIQGEYAFVKLSDDLEPEKSHNMTGSFNYTKAFGDFQTNFVVEGFYTQLNDAFTTENTPHKTASGLPIRMKTNTKGVDVYGVNLEMNLAYTKRFLAQFGLTVQKSKYEEVQTEDEIEDDGTFIKTIYTYDHILRTPDIYGFFSLNYKPIDALNLSWSGVYTGSMDTPHGDVVVNTPSFLENNFKVSYDIDFNNSNCLVLSAGIQNAFNSIQDDFDVGPDRDAAYIYGPRRPRTVFVGLKYSFAR